MAIQGVVTLDGDEIGTFDLNDKGEMVFVLHKVAADIEDALELAGGNGMTLALALKLDFDDYVPQHKR